MDGHRISASWAVSQFGGTVRPKGASVGGRHDGFDRRRLEVTDVGMHGVSSVSGQGAPIGIMQSLFIVGRGPVVPSSGAFMSGASWESG